MHKIKEFRTLIGLKQLELAKIVGVSKQSISAYELGKKEPPLNILVRIAIALDSTPDELIEFRKVHDKLSQGILELIQKTKEPRN
jgi:putative transcriptional regulator